MTSADDTLNAALKEEGTGAPADLARGDAWVIFDLDGVFLDGDTFRSLALRQFRRQPIRVFCLLRDLLSNRLTSSGVLAIAARAAVRGLSTDEYQRLAVSVANDLSRSRKIVPRAIVAAQNHQDRGRRVLVATASERHLARSFLDLIGLGDVELVSSELELPSGNFAPHNRGAVKAASVAARTGTQTWGFVYTDSQADLPILERAQNPVMVNPGAKAERRILAALGPNVAVRRSGRKPKGR